MTILQVLRGLGYGGVETYVVKLAAGLIARGHRVLVASSGGPLVSELKKAGVDWYKVRTRGIGFFTARYELARIIRREDVDVVNAHQLSMGMTAYPAVQSTGTPLILSIHGARTIEPRHLPFVRTSKVLAVSEYSYDNLIRQGLSPAQVVSSFIGVDVERFHPGTPSPELQAALGVSPVTPLILHVSRFSREKGKVAVALADAAPSLLRSYPALVILLAGTGHYEGEVTAAAARANARIGRQAVRLIGPRSDLPELMRLATLVVGTASVALEAMASGCPVVAAGKYGFVGPITADSFATAKTSCFGDHAASTPISAQVIEEAILSFLRDDRLRRASIEWGRRKMVESYNLDRMIDHIERTYTSMCRQRHK